ncbi:MAG: thioredoxin family protein [Betaproteobacteria bacterium]|nr:thioredoxin family protein [Betaproteobacteria bacterium]
MHIKVFGPGCARCTTTEDLVKEVAAAKGGNITVQKVTDLKEMMVSGIVSTPAVVIDGIIKSTGRVPTKEEIAAWIDGAAGAPSTSAAPGCGCGGKC